MKRNWILRGGLASVPVILALFLVSDRRAHTQTAPPLPAPPGLEKIQHFVFIMQENRSFDHYFGTYPGAEGIPPGVCLPAVLPGVPCVAPYHNPAVTNFGGQHFNQNAIADIDGGRMDGFVAQGAGAQGDVMGW